MPAFDARPRNQASQIPDQKPGDGKIHSDFPKAGIAPNVNLGITEQYRGAPDQMERLVRSLPGILHAQQLVEGMTKGRGALVFMVTLDCEKLPELAARPEVMFVQAQQVRRFLIAQ